MKKMKIFQVLIGAVLLGFSLKASAIPTLHFDGEISYDSATSLIHIDSVLSAAEGFALTPNILGSSLSFSALLNSVNSVSLPGPHPGITVGIFNGVPGDGLSVIDNDNNTLLTADFINLQLRGVNNLDFGVITGNFEAMSGSLASEFLTGDLFALQLNLSTSFSAGMFRNSFSGNVDGRIVGVPEPDILILLGSSLAFMGFVSVATHRRRPQHQREQ